MNGTTSSPNPTASIDLAGGLAGGTIIGAIAVVVGLFYNYFRHTRLRSVCCGKIAEMSLDLSSSTPPPLSAPSLVQK
jgi:hypothetical protein